MSRLLLPGSVSQRFTTYTTPDTVENIGTLISVFFRLVTDANAATREVSLRIEDKQGNVVSNTNCPATVAANENQVFTFAAYGDPFKQQNIQNCSFPPTPLIGGDRIRIQLENDQIGDEISEWMVDIVGFFEALQEARRS